MYLHPWNTIIWIKRHWADLMYTARRWRFKCERFERFDFILLVILVSILLVIFSHEDTNDTFAPYPIMLLVVVLFHITIFMSCYLMYMYYYILYMFGWSHETGSKNLLNNSTIIISSTIHYLLFSLLPLALSASIWQK